MKVIKWRNKCVSTDNMEKQINVKQNKWVSTYNMEKQMGVNLNRLRGRLRAWDTLTMSEATLCGRSWVQSPTGAI